MLGLWLCSPNELLSPFQTVFIDFFLCVSRFYAFTDRTAGEVTKKWAVRDDDMQQRLVVGGIESPAAEAFSALASERQGSHLDCILAFCPKKQTENATSTRW